MRVRDVAAATAATVCTAQGVSTVIEDLVGVQAARRRTYESCGRREQPPRRETDIADVVGREKDD